MAKKQRADQILLQRGMAANLDEAKRLIMAGKVLSEGQLILAPSQQISPNSKLDFVIEAQFVSRGGEKLQGAFEEFKFSVDGLVCADVGASTGGFTDCLLQHNAARVYAIDVGYGILDWKLRNDSRVIPLERTNARQLGKLPEPVDFITADVSFISLKAILPSLVEWYSEAGGEAVLLVKPQFEAAKEESARGAGVISSPEIHRRVLQEVLGFAGGLGFEPRGVTRSPLRGPAGNQEFLAWLVYPEKENRQDSLEEIINALF